MTCHTDIVALDVSGDVANAHVTMGAFTAGMEHAWCRRLFMHAGATQAALNTLLQHLYPLPARPSKHIASDWRVIVYRRQRRLPHAGGYRCRKGRRTVAYAELRRTTVRGVPCCRVITCRWLLLRWRGAALCCLPPPL